MLYDIYLKANILKLKHVVRIQQLLLVANNGKLAIYSATLRIKSKIVNPQLCLISLAFSVLVNIFL